MNKAIKQQKKKTTEPTTMCTSIRAMCNHEVSRGKPDYFTQICNRIGRTCEEDNDLFEYILLNPRDLEDIQLRADGILMFSDILMSYFDEKEILDLYRYIRDLDKMEESKSKMHTIIKTMTNEELIKILPSLDGETAKLIKAEQKHRVANPYCIKLL